MMAVSVMGKKRVTVKVVPANREVVIPVHQVHHAMKKRIYATAL
jgi:hypothetical protein